MTPLSITRIENQLQQRFDGLIDMSDVESHGDDQYRNVFLSRALAALCVKSLANVDADVAGRSITDGFQDNFLDAIYFNQTSEELLLVQSKWSNDGANTFDSKATLGMASGVRDLLNTKFDLFNAKVRAKEAEIKAALFSARTKIVLVTAHTAVQPIAPFVQRNVDDLRDELNKAVIQAESKHFNQAGIFSLIAAESAPPKISLPISLREWGIITSPFRAFYGRVHANEVAQWWTDHGNDLFSRNLRFLYSRSTVNDALNATLSSNPEFFWYFNNGITVICDSIGRFPAGSPGREIGLFTCEGANIVNGAQTVGTIGKHWKVDEADANTWIQVRIISLEHCPPDFANSITRATNHQNMVGNREFASMDSQQHRLATEFVLDMRQYAFRQGETKPHGNDGCDIEEATIALACATSIALTVEAKKEIGALWANTSAPPYTELFNEKTSSFKVWRFVQIMRTVDDELHKLRGSADAPRAELIGIHLNRVILHLVLKDPQMGGFRAEGSSEEQCLLKAREVSRTVFAAVIGFIQDHHPDEYPAAFAKNVTKCEELVMALRPIAKGSSPPPREMQPMGLFEDHK